MIAVPASYPTNVLSAASAPFVPVKLFPAFVPAKVFLVPLSVVTPPDIPVKFDPSP